MIKNLLIGSLFALSIMIFQGCTYKTTDDSTASKNSSSLGIGKCGTGMKGKCGVGKCGASLKADGMKCGTGKCGSAEKATGN
jgi:uncharacterized low-complexity protein